MVPIETVPFNRYRCGHTEFEIGQNTRKSMKMLSKSDMEIKKMTQITPQNKLQIFNSSKYGIFDLKKYFLFF